MIWWKILSCVMYMSTCIAAKLTRTSKCWEVQELSKYCVVLLRRPRHNIIWHLVITNGLIMQFLSLNCPNINNGFLPPPDLFMASAETFIEVSSRSYWRVKTFHVLLRGSIPWIPHYKFDGSVYGWGPYFVLLNCTKLLNIISFVKTLGSRQKKCLNRRPN